MTLRRLVGGLVLLVAGGAATPALAAIVPCEGGYRMFRDFRVDINGITAKMAQNVFCAPTQDDLVAGTQAAVGAAIASGGAGVSAGAGALTSEPNTVVRTQAGVDISFEFVLAKVDPTLPDLAVRPVTFEGALVTLRAEQSVSGSGSVRLGGSGVLSLAELDDMGRLLGQTDFKINANLVTGSVLPIVGSSSVRVGDPYAFRLSVSTQTRALALSDAEGRTGSAAGDLSLALSADLLPPEGYEIQLAIAGGPALGAYPDIDSPLTLIPLPAPLVLLGSALALLPTFGCRRRGA